MVEKRYSRLDLLEEYTRASRRAGHPLTVPEWRAARLTPMVETFLNHFDTWETLCVQAFGVGSAGRRRRAPNRAAAR